MRKFTSFDNRGFTLLNVAVGLGIGGIVMLGMAAAVQMTFKAQKSTDLKTISMTYTDELSRVMAGTNSCARALVSGGATLGGSPTNVTINGMTAGSKLAPKLEIEELTIRANPSIPDTPAAGGIGYVRKGGILTVKVRDLDNPDIPFRARTIPFKAVTDPSGQIMSCSTESSEVQVCENMGGLWDATALDGQKCRPKGFCQYGGSFSQAPQGGYMNPVTGTYGCRPGFVQQASGAIANTVATSKENFRTTHYPVYTCMRCESNALSGTTLGNNVVDNDFSAAVAEAEALAAQQDAWLQQGWNFIWGW